MRPVKTSNVSGIWMGCRIETGGKQLAKVTYVSQCFFYAFFIIFIFRAISWLNIIGGATTPPTPHPSWGMRALARKPYVISLSQRIWLSVPTKTLYQQFLMISALCIKLIECPQGHTSLSVLSLESHLQIAKSLIARTSTIRKVSIAGLFES